MRFAESRGMVYASHALSPFFLEGMKGFAYEVCEQLSRQMPDHVVFPVGNGSLLIGAYMGFSELAARGSLSRIPALHAVQSEAVSPVVEAFHGRPWSKVEGSRPWPGAYRSPSRHSYTGWCRRSAPQEAAPSPSRTTRS